MSAYVQLRELVGRWTVFGFLPRDGEKVASLVRALAREEISRGGVMTLQESDVQELWERFEPHVRTVVREEIASLAGLVVRRSQDAQLTRSPDRNLADEVVRETLARVFGEALADFGGSESAPGGDDE